MKREKPDIVHTHAAKAGALGRLAAIFSGVPIKVHTFHGHIFDGYFSPFKAAVFLFIERFLALFTNRVITVSDAVKDEIVNKLRVTSRTKCVVVPLGLELDKFIQCSGRSGTIRKEFDIEDEALVVGIVGRLVPIKNHKMFLDVANMVSKKVLASDVRFMIIGDGEMRPSLEEYANEIGISQHVVFTGWRKEIASAYADLDIVALTSLNEGTPVSLIEAMASAKPVIATNVGGIRDIIIHGENGLLAKSGDAKEFSDRLIELLMDGEMRMRLGSRGRESVRTKYSKERLVKDIEAVYEECLRERKA
jgi:glycosyltransferase involved in cell wall biosynthesis